MLAERYGRMTTMILCVTLGAIAFGPSLAEAADAAKIPSSFTEFFSMNAMPAMHMIDADKKGYVTKEEFMKFMEEFFDRMDKDHSGKVNAEEWVGHKPGKKGEAKSKQGDKMGADKTESGAK